MYVEILELIKERGLMTPFEIAFYGRLNHKRTKECMDYLSLSSFVRQIGKKDVKLSYVLTNEGAQLLQRLEALLTDCEKDFQG